VSKKVERDGDRVMVTSKMASMESEGICDFAYGLSTVPQRVGDHHAAYAAAEMVGPRV
jgi:hypothetical protein